MIPRNIATIAAFQDLKKQSGQKLRPQPTKIARSMAMTLSEQVECSKEVIKEVQKSTINTRGRKTTREALLKGYVLMNGQKKQIGTKQDTKFKDRHKLTQNKSTAKHPSLQAVNKLNKAESLPRRAQGDQRQCSSFVSKAELSPS